jgi:methionyl-tRNA formyltransferase
VRLVFAGTPAAAVPSLTALLSSDHEVLAVLTRPDAPAGRGKKLTASPVRELAEAHGIRVLTPVKPREAIEELTALAPDVCPVVAYGALLPADVLAVPTIGWVNLHFSLLPAYRGAAPVQHAIWHGEEVSGATTFLLDAGMDTGPFFGVLTEPIAPTDTAGDLLGRLAEAGAGLLTATLDAIEAGTIRAETQPPDGVSLAPKITVEDAHVDWTEPALAVDRRIRACTPAPGAWTTLDGQRCKLGPVRPLASSDLAPGQLDGTRVGTGGRDVRLTAVQPAGRAMTDAESWARGARLQRGAMFR